MGGGGRTEDEKATKHKWDKMFGKKGDYFQIFSNIHLSPLKKDFPLAIHYVLI